MPSCKSSTLAKCLLLSVILVGGLILTFLGIGPPIVIAENTSIRTTLIVIGISLSTVAAGSIAAMTGTHCDPHAASGITLHRPRSADPNVEDPCCSAVPKVAAVWSHSGSRIHSFDEGICPGTDVQRSDSVPSPPTRTDLESVIILPALPGLDTSSDSAACEGVRSLSYNAQCNCSEQRKAYRVYDLDMEERYSASKCFAAEASDKDNAARRPSKPKKISRLYEAKDASMDTDTTRIAIKVDAGDKEGVCKEDSSDVNQETQPLGSSEDTVDLQAKRSGVPTEVSLNPLVSSNTGRSNEGMVYKNNLRLQQGSITDPNDKQESTKPEFEIALVSQSSLTRRFANKIRELGTNDSVCL